MPSSTGSVPVRTPARSWSWRSIPIPTSGRRRPCPRPARSTRTPPRPAADLRGTPPVSLAMATSILSSAHATHSRRTGVGLGARARGLGARSPVEPPRPATVGHRHVGDDHTHKPDGLPRTALRPLPSRHVRGVPPLRQPAAARARPLPLRRMRLARLLLRLNPTPSTGRPGWGTMSVCRTTGNSVSPRS